MSKSNVVYSDNIVSYDNIKNIDNSDKNIIKKTRSFLNKTNYKKLPRTLQEKEEYLRKHFTYTTLDKRGFAIPPKDMPKYKSTIRSMEERKRILGQEKEEGFISNILDNGFFPFLGLSGPGWIFFIGLFFAPIASIIPVIISNIKIILEFSVLMARIAIISVIIYGIFCYGLTYYTFDNLFEWISGKIGEDDDEKNDSVEFNTNEDTIESQEMNEAI